MTPSAPPGRPLTIIHVAAPAPVGGLERVVTALATGHARSGHRVHVVSVFDQNEEARPLAAGIPGVETHVVRIPPRRYWRERAAVAALARAAGADVLHTHGYRPDVVDAGAARSLGIPVVTTVHGFTAMGPGIRGRLYEWLQVRSYRRFDAVVAVARRLEATLAAAGVARSQLFLIPNAWSGWAQPPFGRAEARRALGLPDGPPCLGWVGRLSREKAPDLLLDALALLRDVSCLAAFVGAGREEPALRERAAALGVADRVVWCGLVPDAARLYAAFDLFVLSSRTEGTPIALFEAMAAGTPLIATEVGGVPDVVSEREAWLVPAGDPAALARAVRAALADPAAASARAAAARARLDAEFAPGPWLARYEALYRRILERRRPA